MLTYIPADPAPRRIPTEAEPVTVHLRSPAPNLTVPSHRHAWAQIAYPFSGSIRVTAANMTWIVPSRRAVWIPPDIEHEVTMLGEVELRTIYIAASHAPHALSKCAVFDVSDLLRALFEALQATGSEGRAAEEGRCHLIRQLILTELEHVPLLSLGLPMPSDRRLQTLCEALAKDPGSSHTLAEWADEVGASSRTLARLFDEELNMGFGEWRQQLRLARAIDMMGRGEALNVIAATLGYASLASFTVMFKRALGVPPSRFDKARMDNPEKSPPVSSSLSADGGQVRERARRI